jgi:hypothetical protein
VRGVKSISDSVIRMRGSGTAIEASCYGSSYTDATNVTLLGNGSPGSTGAVTRTTPGNGLYNCSGAGLALRNSIVRGFAISLREDRSGGRCDQDFSIYPNTQDCPNGAHQENVLAASYSDYDPSRVRNDRPVSVDAGHNVNVDPRFMYAAGGQFQLRFDSPVIDRGADRAPGQLDVAGHRRSVDAHRVGSGIVDMGAFEYQGTGPEPRISALRSARVGQRIALSGYRSSDPDGGPLTYNWQFGDGSAPANGARVTHTFRRPGPFRVYLRVTDFAGQQASTSKIIRITR